ncbi:hypothetical protein [Synechococcus sp. CS-1328]|uniref:hypothetical protein n=1 Tax=Synechococcus sp. CS-1328 TaxID=2847976 RepID=UPI00223B9080|nr:hypothetical protein [Synechococcus sp. CS-1328]MCT0224829.1 hypothetical protein [Synechococcus sp. CS-1328]
MTTPASHPPEDLSHYLAAIFQELQRLNARLELRPPTPKSPWLPLAEAAQVLHFPSSRALRAAIDRGRIPTQFVSATRGETGKRRTIDVDVEGFASHLRNK